MTGLNIFLLVLAGLIGLLGLGSLGFLIAPRPFRAHPAPTHLGERLPLNPNLPEPVRRHFVETLGETAPAIQTAVIWGRGRICVNGVWMPQRFKSFYRAGDAFFRRIEGTFFMRPVMRGLESYLHHHGAYKVGGKMERGASVDQSQAVGLWAEMVWLPSVLAQDPRVQWQAVDEHTARLIIDREGQNVTLLAHFDPLTGRMTHLQGTRPTSQDGETEPWQMDLMTWKQFHGLWIPDQVSMAWGQGGSPWSYWTIDGVAYNVNVSDQLGETGETNPSDGAPSEQKRNRRTRR